MLCEPLPIAKITAENFAELINLIGNEKITSPAAKKLLKKMKGALDVAERYIGKEIKDVEKELE